MPSNNQGQMEWPWDILSSFATASYKKVNFWPRLPPEPASSCSFKSILCIKLTLQLNHGILYITSRRLGEGCPHHCRCLHHILCLAPSTQQKCSVSCDQPKYYHDVLCQFWGWEVKVKPSSVCRQQKERGSARWKGGEAGGERLGWGVCLPVQSYTLLRNYHGKVFV